MFYNPSKDWMPLTECNECGTINWYFLEKLFNSIDIMFVFKCSNCGSRLNIRFDLVPELVEAGKLSSVWLY